MSQTEPRSITTSRELMELAIEQMRRVAGPGPKVGAVLARDGRVVGVGHRTDGRHAERAAIEEAQAQGDDPRGAVLYSTLEPCVSTGSAREACAPLIVRTGISAVYIGRYDTNPAIYREGWKVLRDAGVVLRDFDADLRSQIDAANAQFTGHFVSGVGPSGGAKFDYRLNGGNFDIRHSATDVRSIRTQWTHRGPGSIYAYAVQPVRVALARHATSFSEIDDPRAFDFTYTVPVSVGEIAIFACPTGAALVKVLAVESGGSTTSVKVQYEVRTLPEP